MCDDGFQIFMARLLKLELIIYHIDILTLSTRNTHTHTHNYGSEFGYFKMSAAFPTAYHILKISIIICARVTTADPKKGSIQATYS